MHHFLTSSVAQRLLFVITNSGLTSCMTIFSTICSENAIFSRFSCTQSQKPMIYYWYYSCDDLCKADIHNLLSLLAHERSCFAYSAFKSQRHT